MFQWVYPAALLEWWWSVEPPLLASQQRCYCRIAVPSTVRLCPLMCLNVTRTARQQQSKPTTWPAAVTANPPHTMVNMLQHRMLHDMLQRKGFSADIIHIVPAALLLLPTVVAELLALFAQVLRVGLGPIYALRTNTLG